MARCSSPLSLLLAPVAGSRPLQPGSCTRRRRGCTGGSASRLHRGGRRLAADLVQLALNKVEHHRELVSLRLELLTLEATLLLGEVFP